MKRARMRKGVYSLSVERLEDRTLLNATLLPQNLAAESPDLSAFEISAEREALTPTIADASNSYETMPPSVGRGLLRTAGTPLPSGATPVDSPAEIVVVTVKPEVSSFEPNVLPAADISNDVDSTTVDPDGPSGREVVKGIHTRHPDWQVDTAWVNSGNFTVSSFMEWYTNQSDAPANPVDRPSVETRPTLDEHSTPGSSVVSPSDSSLGTVDHSDVTVSPAGQTPIAPSKVYADESGTAAPAASDGSAQAPEVFVVVPAYVTKSDAALGSSGSDSSLSPQWHVNGDTMIERGLLVVRARHGGLGNFEIAVHVPAETPISELSEVALGLQNTTFTADESSDQTRGFVPHSVGLHTSMSAFDAPVIDLGAFGEQLSDLVKSITESETNMLLASCFVAIVAAGVGCEIVRRHYRRVTPQLATATAGRLPEDWLLG